MTRVKLRRITTVSGYRSFAPYALYGLCLSLKTQNAPVHFHRESILHFTRLARLHPSLLEWHPGNLPTKYSLTGPTV